MELNFIVTIIFFFSFWGYNVNSEEPVIFDIRKYGAGSGDISQALLDAWTAACNSTTPSVVLIPPGTWHLSQVKLVGPNKAPLELQVQGTVQADPDLNKLPNKDGQWITINYVDYFTLSGGGVFDGQGLKAWKQNDCGTNPNCAKTPINLSFNFIKNSMIRDMTSKDSKNWHVNCISSKNVTFLRFTISAPGDSINTDGIHLARDTMINITDSVIGTGDDCISIGDDMKDLYIQNVICGPGHGISIGSLGKNVAEKDVQGIYVRNCTFKGTDNGVRIKTWPSAPAQLQISDLHFDDLIMDNVKNPVIFDQEYCPYNLCKLDKPSLIKISKVTLKNIRGTSATPEVMSFLCSGAKPCENIHPCSVCLIS
ncbi:Polygalacturonase [Handroanthus impetiginosus]|uniref:Polygalacturonase n=1 Tax=Handroanthus impetiginosus TaxID=429701 RepID=A0A2G9FZ76_9LAMI|nr:Polygalacturonase [Handroanthus impetiginosus]